MSLDADGGSWASSMGQDNCLRLDRMPVVTIAAVNATALGGGLELAIACDLTYASNTASFAQAETRGGVVPGFGGTTRLPRRVGTMRARWMTYTGHPIDAETALQWGLVMDVFPAEVLMSKVHEIARQILAAQTVRRSRGEATALQNIGSSARRSKPARTLCVCIAHGTF